MPRLNFYAFLSRFRWLNYRGKIMLTAFLGTHIPLLALIGLFVFRSTADTGAALLTLGVALVATLVGTGITLWVLNQLLRPIVYTSAALRAYRMHRRRPELPTNFADEAGTLMADAARTLEELDDALDDLANYDKVTGLPNRGMLLSAIARQAAQGERFALAAIRLANYDRIATALDQKTAAETLWKVARDLQAAAEGFGGTFAVEPGLFAVVLPADVDGAAAGIARLVAAAGAEFAFAGVTVRPELVAGVALHPEDATTPEQLLDAARAAIGEAGDATSSVAFYSPAAREAARTRFLTEQELRRAIAMDEFRLHLQPVVDLRAGRSVGAEALIRWQHPDRGLVMPGAFIPVAESSGLIDAIGKWVVQAAAAQLRQWRNIGRGDLTLAVNLSASQFLDPDLLPLIREALAESRVSPDRLEIELTETAAMRDRERTAQIFGRLRDLGIRVAIDDFGTGYSNMSNLRRLSFDKLKIDREFVSGVAEQPGLRAIASAMVRLAHGFGATVVAEGAEHVEEVRVLHDEGCDLFQGYYFARPVSPEAFGEAISDLRMAARVMAVVEPDAEPATGRRSVA